MLCRPNKLLVGCFNLQLCCGQDAVHAACSLSNKMQIEGGVNIHKCRETQLFRHLYACLVHTTLSATDVAQAEDKWKMVADP